MKLYTQTSSLRRVYMDDIAKSHPISQTPTCVVGSAETVYTPKREHQANCLTLNALGTITSRVLIGFHIKTSRFQPSDRSNDRQQRHLQHISRIIPTEIQICRSGTSYTFYRGCYTTTTPLFFPQTPAINTTMYPPTDQSRDGYHLSLLFSINTTHGGAGAPTRCQIHSYLFSPDPYHTHTFTSLLSSNTQNTNGCLWNVVVSGMPWSPFSMLLVAHGMEHRHQTNITSLCPVLFHERRGAPPCTTRVWKTPETWSVALGRRIVGAVAHRRLPLVLHDQAHFNRDVEGLAYDQTLHRGLDHGIMALSSPDLCPINIA